MTERSFLQPSCPTFAADVILLEADTWSRFPNILFASSRVIFDSVTVIVRSMAFTIDFCGIALSTEEWSSTLHALSFMENINVRLSSSIRTFHPNDFEEAMTLQVDVLDNALEIGQDQWDLGNYFKAMSVYDQTLSLALLTSSTK